MVGEHHPSQQVADAERCRRLRRHLKAPVDEQPCDQGDGPQQRRQACQSAEQELAGPLPIGDMGDDDTADDEEQADADEGQVRVQMQRADDEGGDALMEPG